jgi:hypothetical protein
LAGAARNTTSVFRIGYRDIAINQGVSMSCLSHERILALVADMADESVDLMLRHNPISRRSGTWPETVDMDTVRP